MPRNPYSSPIRYDCRVRTTTRRRSALTPNVRTFATARKTPLRAVAPTAASDKIARKINFRSQAAVQKTLKSQRVDADKLGPTLASVYKASPTNALKMSKAVVRGWKRRKDAQLELRAMVRWAAKSGKKERRMICKTFGSTRQNVLLVHGIAELGSPKETRAFMKDYFASGGDMKSVAEWLAAAGGVLRKLPNKRPGTAGGAIDAVGDFLGGAADAVTGAVTSVVDAVVKAGKSIASAVADAASWALDKIKDLVRALIQAGKKFTEILAAAVSKGEAVFKKFVKAVLSAGKSVAQVMSWVASKVLNTVKWAVKAIIEAGKSVASIMAAIVGKAASIVNKVVKALISIGRTAGSILAAIANKAAAVFKNVVKSLIAAGVAVVNVVRSVLMQAAAVIEKTIQALFSLGHSIASLLQGAVTSMFHMLTGQMKKLLAAMLKLGKTVAQIMAAAISEAGQILRAVALALIKLGKTIHEILKTVAGKALNLVQLVVSGVIMAGKTVAKLMAAAIKFSAAVLKKIVTAAYKVTKKVAQILMGVAGRIPSIIRTVLEGLFAVGVNLVKAVVAICKNVVEKFREGFFKGLLALGKVPLEILKAALKAGLAVLGLAVAVFMEIWGGHRRLTAEEVKEARRVFGWSIDLDRVRIARASIPADVANWLNGQRPFTTMYIINFSSRTAVTKKVLIHELTHVWQGVTAGPIYMAEALHAQLFGGGYTVTDKMLRDNNGDFSKFNREQQATIVEEYWDRRWGGQTGVNYSLYEPYANQVYKKKPRSSWFSRLVPIARRGIRPVPVPIR